MTQNLQAAGQTLNNSYWSIEGSLSKEISTPPTIPQQSIPALFFHIAKEEALRRFAKYKKEIDGETIEVSWEEASEHVALMAYFLREKFNVRSEQRIAIFSTSRYEWLIADLALMSLGAVSTPIYQSLPANEAAYILWNSDAQIVFAENQEQVEKLASIDGHNFTFAAPEKDEKLTAKLRILSVISFEEVSSNRFNARLFNFWDIVNGKVLEKTSHSKSQLVKTLSKSVNKIPSHTLASIVYTSGTTAVPKGVMQTHRNHIAMLDGILQSGLLANGEDIFLFLPLAHSFARLIAYAAIASGGNLIFPTVINRKKSTFDAKQLFLDVQQLSPQIFPSVPRLFEKLMTSISGNTNQKSVSIREWARKKIVRWSLKHFEPLKAIVDSGQELSGFKLLRFTISKGVVKKLRSAVFGENLRYCISGGAPLDPEVALFFKKFGVDIFEGYGLTETCPALTANTPSFNKIGSVGRPFAGVELKISDIDGEILAKGQNIALGYFKMPKASGEVFLDDGWFASGDIGRIDEEGYLWITDRKKDLIVTAGGKNIAPALIEGKVKNSRYISHIVVYGDKRPYLVALITLDDENIKRFATSNISDFKGKAIEEINLGDITENPDITSLIQSEIDNLCKDLAHFEQIKRFTILVEDFSVENGLLSPSYKVKRKAVINCYMSQIDSLYEQASS